MSALPLGATACSCGAVILTRNVIAIADRHGDHSHEDCFLRETPNALVERIGAIRAVTR